MNTRFPPVGYEHQEQPWGNPQWVPPLPMRMPDKGGRSSAPGAAGIMETRSDHQYARIIDFNVAVGATSAKVLDEPAGLRNLLVMRNASATQTVYIGFSVDASTLSTIALTPGQSLMFDSVVPQDDIYAIASAAGGSLSIAYSTIPKV